MRAGDGVDGGTNAAGANEAEEEDFQDFLRMRGEVLDGVKTEFAQFRALLNQLSVNTLSKERELSAKAAELTLTEDQIAGCKRVVEDSVFAQEGLEKMMSTMSDKSKKYSDTEQSNRREITTVEYNRQDLLKALEVGADWRPRPALGGDSER